MSKALIRWHLMVISGLLFDAQCSFAQDTPSGTAIELPSLEVSAEPLGDRHSAVGYNSPAAALNSLPQADLQSRNSPELQADLTIRGGTFENSGLNLGAVSLADPQTGHYLLETPIEPLMMNTPRLTTGAEHALTSIQSTSGAVAYSFKPIGESGTKFHVGAGDYSTTSQAVYGSTANLGTIFAGTVGADFSAARSVSSGSRRGGDHDLKRAAARVQLLGPARQTDVYFGHQEKDFSWPDLYAPQTLHERLGTSGIEAEYLSTTLFLLNHRQSYGSGSYAEITPVLRRNQDDYEFDKFQPGLFNPYQHRTTTGGAGVKGLHEFNSTWGLNWGGQVTADKLESTALTFGPFNSRTYSSASLAPVASWNIDPELAVSVTGGAAITGTNRDGARVSPLFRTELTDLGVDSSSNSYFMDISQSSQLPTYTALNSNPNQGLFRGDPELARTVSTQYELGYEHQRQEFLLRAVGFYCYDHDLVDWTYQTELSDSAARIAQNLNLGTSGAAVRLKKTWRLFDLDLNYEYLAKQSDYQGAPVDASFYALNYPEHRVAASMETALNEWVKVRLWGEFRKQEPNALRTSRDTTYLLCSSELLVAPAQLNGVTASLLVSNIGSEDFEEVPGVPGSRRTVLARLEYDW